MSVAVFSSGVRFWVLGVHLFLFLIDATSTLLGLQSCGGRFSHGWDLVVFKME
jgi:hypothetical protein